MENLGSVLTVVGDVKPHLFKFWYNEDVINPLLVYTTRNGIDVSLIVGGSGPFIAIPKQPYFTFSHICEELFIVHMILHREFAQVYPGEM